MRTVSLAALAAASLLALPTADAQRRYDSEPVGGTDLQLLADGLDVNGVGLRFWMGPQTAIAVRARVGYDRIESTPDDQTQLELGLGIQLENHLYRRARVHPYLGGGLSVGSRSVSVGSADATATTFGGELALGAEARLMPGLTLSGQYGAGVAFSTGDLPGGADSRVEARLGGTPRVALSLRF